MHTKRFNTFFKRWVQFRVGAIPRLPFKSKINCILFVEKLYSKSPLLTIFNSTYSELKRNSCLKIKPGQKLSIRTQAKPRLS